MSHDPTLTVAVALTTGMLAQALARHLRVPSILVLLVAGVLVGPDMLDLVHPKSLGSSLHTLVGAAVAVILFEGGLRLQLRRLRSQPRAIRRLVTWGALLSSLGGGLAARCILGWEWRVALLFGILMMVTGPTVITPLLQRFRIHRNVATVLEAEGVLIDAVGAITATVALEVALRPSEEGLMLAAPAVLLRLGFGALVGVVGGGILAWILRSPRVVAGELRNALALAIVLLLHAGANALLSESGLAAAIVAGITVANASAHVVRALADFKQQLVHLLIGMLFLLLVADVRLAEVTELGWAGALTVVVLMVVVRPATVFLCTLRTPLRLRERALIAWLSPRGVVAAAIASLFAYKLQAAGAEGGLELRALVFATIGATVVCSSLTGGIMASFLRLRRPSGQGWAILGGNSLARQLAALLGGEHSVLLDNDPKLVQAAQRSGLRALHGNAFDDRLLARADLEGRSGAVGVTTNPDANLLFVQHARQFAPELRYLVAVRDELDGVTPELVRAENAEVLFGGLTDIELWSKRLERRRASVEWWECTRPTAVAIRAGGRHPPFIPLVHLKNGHMVPVGDDRAVTRGHQLAIVIDHAHRHEAHAWLLDAGFGPSSYISAPLSPLSETDSGMASA